VERGTWNGLQSDPKIPYIPPLTYQSQRRVFSEPLIKPSSLGASKIDGNEFPLDDQIRLTSSLATDPCHDPDRLQFRRVLGYLVYATKSRFLNCFGSRCPQRYVHGCASRNFIGLMGNGWHEPAATHAYAFNMTTKYSVTPGLRSLGDSPCQRKCCLLRDLLRGFYRTMYERTGLTVHQGQSIGSISDHLISGLVPRLLLPYAGTCPDLE